MPNVTDLARARIDGADEIIIQLIREPDVPAAERTTSKPTTVRIVWPAKPVIDPSQFRDVAAAMVKLFSEAHVELTRIKARKYTL